MGFGDWISNAWTSTKNWVGKQVHEWKTNPLGKVKSIGNSIADTVGKASGIISGLNKGVQFIKNIPVIGDIASNTPGLSNVMNGIETADKYAGKVNGLVQGGNNLVQRLPSKR